MFFTFGHVLRNFFDGSLKFNIQCFPYENHCKRYKKLGSRLWFVLLTFTYFFSYTYSPVLLQNKKFLCRPSQIACTVTNMNVMCAQETLSVHNNSCTFVNLSFFFFFFPCPWIILSSITSCEGHKL